MGEREQELLRAWRSGDRAAGDQLLREHYDELLGFFRLRIPHAAEDLVQLTFLACAESKERIQSERFRGFLFGVARRQLLKFLEQQRRTPDDSMYFVGAVRPPSVVTPSRAMALRQEHWLLLRGLETLDTEHQIVLALFYVQGLSTSEIAEACEIKVTTVTSRLHRARQALREAIEAGAAQTRDAVMADLESWMRSLGPLTRSLPSVH